MAHIPNPGDFNSPGEQNDPNKIKAAAEGKLNGPAPGLEAPPEALAQELIRKEPGGEEAQPFRPDPNRLVAAREVEATAPQFAPIKQIGQEVTFTLVVPDNRPSLLIPLQGPGAYKISIERRE